MGPITRGTSEKRNFFSLSLCKQRCLSVCQRDQCTFFCDQILYVLCLYIFCAFFVWPYSRVLNAISSHTQTCVYFLNLTCKECFILFSHVPCDFHVVGNLEHTKHKICSNFLLKRDFDLILFALKYP